MKKTIIGFWLLLIGCPTAFADSCSKYPERSAFLGLTESGWGIYLTSQEGDPTPVDTAVEPTAFSYHAGSQRLLYIGIDGRVYLRHGEESDRVVLETSQAVAYTQPAFSEEGNHVYMVGLKEGNSKDTDIVVLDILSGSVEPFSEQRSSQFEPHPTEEVVFYSHVLCVESCGKIIQEVWRKSRVSGEAEQITLLNAISREPTLGPDGDALYFSSNSSGNYNIWRFSLSDKRVEQVTQGPFTDLSPRLDRNKSLYFIRTDARGSHLMCRSAGGSLSEIPLPEPVKAIRALKVSL